MSMKTNTFRLAAGVGLIAFGAPFPACGQFFSNYPVIIVPPPAQNYVVPKPRPKQPPDKSKPADPPPTEPTGRYQGRTYVPGQP
jgi:hypothetical protein